MSLKHFLKKNTHNVVLGVFFVFLSAVPLFVSANNNFVSISDFPAFNFSGASSLSIFINSLYTYLIGIAVVLTISEIIWAGFLWMGSGASVTSKESGKKKLEQAIIGLVLVLSPVIIFNIINPQVLSLRLDTNQMEITQPNSKKTTTSSKIKVLTAKEKTAEESKIEKLKFQKPLVQSQSIPGTPSAPALPL